MIWTTLTEKDTNNAALEDRLWNAAEQFRTNSGITPKLYSRTILSLIFLRFTEGRFEAHIAKSESPSPLGGERAGVKGENYSGDPTRELSIHGVAKTGKTGRLCRVVAVRKDLAVHGLEGDPAKREHGGQINSYYDDLHDACHPLPSDGRGAGGEGDRFDFVLAIPPFNPAGCGTVDMERFNRPTTACARTT
jgi:type I restriction-modification system DNA methylase subunit